MLKTKKIFISALLLFVATFMLKANTNEMAKLEALYVYNISRYVEWPASFNSNSFVIGIVGNNTELLESLKGIAASRTIQGKKIVLKQITAPSQGKECHILFFSEGFENRIGAYRTSTTSSLFISESNGALSRGSDLNFFVHGTKLKFELSKASIDKKSINISTSLLELASKVI